MVDGFNYTATDGLANSTSQLVITVTGSYANTAPVLTADVATVTEDVTLTAVGNVLANDSDVDGDTLSAVQVTGPAHGSLTLNCRRASSRTRASGR